MGTSMVLVRFREGLFWYYMSLAQPLSAWGHGSKRDKMKPPSIGGRLPAGKTMDKERNNFIIALGSAERNAKA